MITTVQVVTKVLLSLHVLAAILAVGPVTVAASMFPAALRRGDAHQLRLLHRICRVYAGVGVAVPVFGFATASSLGVLGDAWLIVNMSVWRDTEALKAFMFAGQHLDALRRRREWFEPLAEAATALWWVPAGHRPTVPEAEQRLVHLREHGPTPYAFTLRQSHPAT